MSDIVKKKSASETQKQEDIFNDMLSLYDDAEEIIKTLKEADTVDRVANFTKMENLLNMLESNVQSLIDAYVSFLSLQNGQERNVVKRDLTRSLKNITSELKNTRHSYE